MFHPVAPGNKQIDIPSAYIYTAVTPGGRRLMYTPWRRDTECTSPPFPVPRHFSSLPLRGRGAELAGRGVVCAYRFPFSPLALQQSICSLPQVPVGWRVLVRNTPRATYRPSVSVETCLGSPAALKQRPKCSSTFVCAVPQRASRHIVVVVITDTIIVIKYVSGSRLTFCEPAFVSSCCWILRVAERSG
jgi:hypothetical protein